MLKKIQEGGIALSANEMKEVRGGALPGRTLWYCEISPGDYAEVCYSIQPKVPCNYADLCGNLGTCPAGLDQCIY